MGFVVSKKATASKVVKGLHCGGLTARELQSLVFGG